MLHQAIIIEHSDSDMKFKISNPERAMCFQNCFRINVFSKCVSRLQETKMFQNFFVAESSSLNIELCASMLEKNVNENLNLN